MKSKFNVKDKVKIIGQDRFKEQTGTIIEIGEAIGETRFLVKGKKLEGAFKPNNKTKLPEMIPNCRYYYDFMVELI